MTWAPFALIPRKRTHRTCTATYVRWPATVGTNGEITGMDSNAGNELLWAASWMMNARHPHCRYLLRKLRIPSQPRRLLRNGAANVTALSAQPGVGESSTQVPPGEPVNQAPKVLGRGGLWHTSNGERSYRNGFPSYQNSPWLPERPASYRKGVTNTTIDRIV